MGMQVALVSRYWTAPFTIVWALSFGFCFPWLPILGLFYEDIHNPASSQACTVNFPLKHLPIGVKADTPCLGCYSRNPQAVLDLFPLISLSPMHGTEMLGFARAQF